MGEQVEIVLRDGPASLRAGLADGADVWEVVAVHRSFDKVEKTANWLDQPVSAIATALPTTTRTDMTSMTGSGRTRSRPRQLSASHAHGRRVPEFLLDQGGCQEGPNR